MVLGHLIFISHGVDAASLHEGFYWLYVPFVLRLLTIREIFVLNVAQKVQGWLYPTPAFAGASLAQPPLTKGRKKSALLPVPLLCKEGKEKAGIVNE